jgi:hypothetical protein
MLTTAKKYGWLALITVISAWLLYVAAASTSFQICTADKENKQTEQSSEKNSSEVLRSLIVSARVKTDCIFVFLYDSRDALTAIATVFIALFTCTLYLATTEQAIEALETTERAFVFLDGFTIELTTAADTQLNVTLPDRYKSSTDLYITRFAIFPRWKNSGNTPTVKMTIKINWRGPPGPIPPDYVYRNPPEPFFLAPKAVEPSSLVEMPGAAALIDWGLQPIGVEPIVLIWGRADYEDVFRKPHFVQWCHRLRFERHDGKTLRAGFVQWGEYNRADESN